jgi:hypothetical protein
MKKDIIKKYTVIDVYSRFNMGRKDKHALGHLFPLRSLA